MRRKLVIRLGEARANVVWAYRKGMVSMWTSLQTKTSPVSDVSQRVSRPSMRL